MKNETYKMPNKIFSNYYTKEDIDFLMNIQQVKQSKEEELKIIEIKEDKVFEKIAADKKRIENDPRDLRECINNSETVLESIETVEKNIDELLDIYRKITKDFIIVTEKSDLNLEQYNFEQDVNNLLNEIRLAKKTEERIKKDNEKNYLIIDSFLNSKFIYNFDDNEKVSFENLTLDNLKDNMILKIFDKRVELPYTKKEVADFLNTYPDNYRTVQDVISKEFIMNISLFNKHPILSRFKEAYYLCRTKEMMSVFDSFNYAKGIMFRSDLNSYIIAASKSKKQLEDYIHCLENNKLNEFSHFKIIFNVNPLAIRHSY